MKTRIRFDLIGLIFVFSLTTGKLYCQNTVTKYDILKETDNGLEIIKTNASAFETQNHFFEKDIYVNDNLDSVILYDKGGNLYDGLYQSAIYSYEYFNNRLKYIKSYDKNKQKIEDGWGGYWSIEFFYDEKGRITKEVFRDKNNLPLKYNPSIDMTTPFCKEFEYLKNGTCIEKDFDNNYKLIKKFKCAYPDTSWIRLRQYGSKSFP